MLDSSAVVVAVVSYLQQLVLITVLFLQVVHVAAVVSTKNA
jgi:hypothetical protein